MEEMNIYSLTGKFVRASEKNSDNKINISAMSGIADTFADDAGLKKIRPPEPGDDMVVIETGHQPNFLPHTGIWKKAFLLHTLCKELEKSERNVIGFFGFADQNLMTADLLYTTRIPSLNKNGFTKIGFKQNSHDVNRVFNEIKKPNRDIWEQKLESIRVHYRNCEKQGGFPTGVISENCEEYLEMLWNAYDRAEVFADVNAFFFSQICRERLGMEILFFRYSDIQKEKIFLEEWKHILENIVEYNAVYNGMIEAENLNLPRVEQNRAPFWLHCICGGKVVLFADAQSNLHGSCPICGEEHYISSDNGFEQLSSLFDRMSLSAVTRDIVLAEGLGEDIFISGTGGSLVYGKISKKISERLGFLFPINLYWKSQDYYIGISQAAALSNMAKTFKVPVQDVASGDYKEQVLRILSGLEHDIAVAEETSERKKRMKLLNKYNNACTLLENIRQVFAVKPSMLDLLVNDNAPDIVSEWEMGLRSAKIAVMNGNMELRQDTRYASIWHPELASQDIEKIYRNIRETGGFS